MYFAISNFTNYQTLKPSMAILHGPLCVFFSKPNIKLQFQTSQLHYKDLLLPFRTIFLLKTTKYLYWANHWTNAPFQWANETNIHIFRTHSFDFSNTLIQNWNSIEWGFEELRFPVNLFFKFRVTKKEIMECQSTPQKRIDFILSWK